MRADRPHIYLVGRKIGRKTYVQRDICDRGSARWNSAGQTAVRKKGCIYGEVAWNSDVRQGDCRKVVALIGFSEDAESAAKKCSGPFYHLCLERQPDTSPE